MNVYKYFDAAKDGDVTAMFKLGWCYFNGEKGVSVNDSLALEWFSQAGARGDGEALYWLGVMHENGCGTPVSLSKALTYYKQAHKNKWDCTDEIARLEAALAAGGSSNTAAAPTLETTSAVAVPTPRVATSTSTSKSSATATTNAAATTPASSGRRAATYATAARTSAAVKEEPRLPDDARKVRPSPNEAARSLEQERLRLQRLESAQKDKEAELNRREKLVKWNEVAQLKKDGALREKEAVQQNKDAALQQRETALKQKEASAQRKAATLQQKDAALQQREAAQQQWEAAQQQKEAALDAEHERLVHQDQVLQRDRHAFDATKREEEARQGASDEARAAAAASAAKAKQEAAVARRAQILAERRSVASKYVAAREAVAQSLAPTKIKLSDCPVHARPLAPGQSVLLDQCLHSICRECAPHMVQSGDDTVICPICKVVSHVEPVAVPPHHPLIEAELEAGSTARCCICAPLPEEDHFPAAVKCTACEPHKYYCEGHAAAHRKRVPAHASAALPHGDALLRCLAHDQPIEAYCTDCRVLVCLACFASTHPPATHHVRLLTDASFVEAFRARLVQGVAAARTVADALVDQITDVAVAVAEVDERDAEIRAHVDRTINVLVGLLERRREAIHNMYIALSRDERAALHAIREESEHDWRIVTSAADVAEQLATGRHLGANAAARLVQLEEAATARLSAVLERAPKRSVPVPAVLRFELDDAVGKRLVNLGRIVQDAP